MISYWVSGYNKIKGQVNWSQQLMITHLVELTDDHDRKVTNTDDHNMKVTD